MMTSKVPEEVKVVLFRAYITKLLQASSDAVPVNLKDESQTREKWSGLPLARLAEEIELMASQGEVKIESSIQDPPDARGIEVTVAYVLRRPAPPASSTAGVMVSAPKRGWTR